MSAFELPESPIILRMADLRQAVEWIAFGFKPIPEVYEMVIRGKTRTIQDSDIAEIDHAKKLLFLALFEDQIIAIAQKEGDPPEPAREDPIRYEIPNYSWQFDKIKWDESQLSPAIDLYDYRLYTNIHLNTNKLYEVFPDPSLKKKSAPAIHHRPSYLSPYMQLLDLAVTEFKISPTNQPSKKILYDWFLDKLKTVQGEQYASESKAKMLATFAREPESQIGGLKKLKKNNPK